MQLQGHLVYLVSLFCLVLASGIMHAVAQTYVADDFEDPAFSAKLWEIVTGDWQVGDGVFHQLAQGDPWLTAMVAQDKWNDAWTEYTIEVSGAQPEPGDHPLNILFRVQDPVPPTWADRNGPNTHMYRWIVNGTQAEHSLISRTLSEKCSSLNRIGR